jgi:peptidyl-prolyl cis-trans isomerase D
MATLEKIRNRAGVLIAIIIGLALLAFILGDFLDSGRTLFNQSRNTIGKIGKEKISAQDYEARVQEVVEIYKLNSQQSSLDDQTMDRIREEVWQKLLQENVLGPQCEKIGLAVSPQEAMDMVEGNDPSPIVRQMFTNQQTGEFNKSALVNFLKTMDQDPSGNQKKFWLYIEDQIISQRLMMKYNNLISKGLYVTNLQASNENIENNRRFDFSYVAQSFSATDSTVKVSSSEIKEYYNNHKKEYKQKASRDIEYVVFDIAPSAADMAEANKWATEKKAAFASVTSDYKQFVNSNSDVPFDDHFHSQSEFTDSIHKSIFNSGGNIVGPLNVGKALVIAKVVDSKMMPDSLKAAHILIRPADQSDAAKKKAHALADSIKTAIEQGADFAQLAAKYSADGSAQKGGELGWFPEGQMIPEFTAACVKTPKGGLTIAETQYGVHIIKVEDKTADVKKVKIAALVRNLEPSTETYHSIYQKASSFAGENNTAAKFDIGAQKANLTRLNAKYIGSNDKGIKGIESARELIRWVYKAKVNDISQIFELNDKFVIAKVTAVREDGIAPLDQVKDQIAMFVRRDKIAADLAAKMKTQIQGAASINDVAAKTGLQIQDANGMTFSSYSVPGAGFEPRLIATAAGSPLNQVSAPVQGFNAVYVLQVKQVIEADPQAVQVSKMRLGAMMMQRAAYEAFGVLSDVVGVNDMRSKFY